LKVRTRWRFPVLCEDQKRTIASPDSATSLTRDREKLALLANGVGGGPGYHINRSNLLVLEKPGRCASPKRWSKPKREYAAIQA
jgi:hypothetical protein